MSRDGGQEKRWHNAHNYVCCTVASITPLRAMVTVMARTALSCCGCVTTLSCCYLLSGEGDGTLPLLSSLCCCRVGGQGQGQGCVAIIVRVKMRVRVRARACHRCQGERGGKGDGEMATWGTMTLEFMTHSNGPSIRCCHCQGERGGSKGDGGMET